MVDNGNQLLPIKQAYVRAYSALSDPTPKSYSEAIQHQKWRQAIMTELEAIDKTETYTIISKESVPKGTQIYSPIWTFKIKANGRYKA